MARTTREALRTVSDVERADPLFDRLEKYFADPASTAAIVDLFLATLASHEWIDRHVVSIILRPDGCNSRRESFDLVVPDELSEGIRSFASGHPKSREVLVPIGLATKDPHRHRISFKDGRGAALSMVNSFTQAAMLTVFCGAWIKQVWTAKGACPYLATAPEPSKADMTLARALLCLLQAPADQQAARALQDLVALLPSEKSFPGREAMVGFLSNLEQNHLVIVRINRKTRYQRQLIKVAYGQGEGVPRSNRVPSRGDPYLVKLPLWFRRFLEALGLYGRKWDTADWVLVVDGEFGVAATRQFEFEAPAGLLVREIDLQAEVADITQHPHDEAIPIRRRRTFYETYLDDLTGRRTQMLRELNELEESGGAIIRMGRTRGARRILRLATRSFYGDERRRLYLINLVVERSFLTWAAAAGASVAFAVLVALLVASGWSLTVETKTASAFASSFALALPLASVALTWLGYGQEHPTASRLFAPFRRVLFSSALVLFAAALAIATVRLETTVSVDSVAGAFRWWSTLPAGNWAMALASPLVLLVRVLATSHFAENVGGHLESWSGGPFARASVLWCLLFSLAVIQGYFVARAWGLLTTTLERNREAT